MNMLKIAGNCADFILTHVGNFLDMSKIETSNIDLNIGPTDFIDLMVKIVEMHKLKAENKNVYLRLNAMHNMPDIVMIDQSRFTQILVNLISNSLKFTQSGGVTVNVSYRD